MLFFVGTGEFGWSVYSAIVVGALAPGLAPGLIILAWVLVAVATVLGD